MQRATQHAENNLIMAPFYTNYEYMSNTIKRGFVPPEEFLYLDKNKKIKMLTTFQFCTTIIGEIQIKP